MDIGTQNEQEIAEMFKNLEIDMVDTVRDTISSSHIDAEENKHEWEVYNLLPVKLRKSFNVNLGNSYESERLANIFKY